MVDVVRSPISEDVDLKALSEMTKGYSGADISQASCATVWSVFVGRISNDTVLEAKHCRRARCVGKRLFKRLRRASMLVLYANET